MRSADSRYTEVAGTPCIVRTEHGDVQPLTPTWAAIWARLDGRSVAEALNVDPATLDEVDARNLIEVLRRLKGRGVIGDADPADTFHDGHDLAATASEPVEITLRGTASRSGTAVVIDPASSQRLTVGLADGPEGTVATIRRRLRKRTVGEITCIDPSTRTEPSRPLERFAVIVRALDDRSVLLRPGAVDLLAGLAERAIAPGSPRR